MVNVRNILYCLILCTMMLSCMAADDVSDVDGGLEQLDLVLSIGKSKTVTRQGIDVIQDEGQPFRGLQGLLAIPFATDDNQPVTSADLPLTSVVSGNPANKIEGSYYYYMDKCYMMRGTNHVLVYGQSATISGKESPVQNGQLETTLTGRMKPSDITFSLQPIRDTYDIHEDAQALAQYMTDIANTPNWSMTSDAGLKALYLDFIHAESEGSGLMAGSAAHVKAYVKALRDQLKDNTDELSLAIVANIDAAAKSCLDNGYPSASTSLGLPDGATALRWTGSAFTVRTQATTLDNINGITRFTYPAELWYYANSGIYTSREEVSKTTYTGDWNTLLTTHYHAGRSVSNDTKSVAVGQPLQYGVGRLKMTLGTIPATMKDSKNQDVSIVSVDKMPMTAVIIGGQHTVGFDFKPMGEPSDVDARFIYDPIVGNTGTVNTLVLQSYDGEKVPIVLEFENKTGQQFTGRDGIIYPNTKFYLIARIDPADKGTGDYANRVFTQDYTTAMTMQANSLANAYSCMPDLLSPRLEIGVQVTTKWVQSTTTTVIL